MELMEERIANLAWMESAKTKEEKAAAMESGSIGTGKLKQNLETEVSKIDILQYVTRVMLNLGMPAHLRGYHYLREAICMSMENMELVGSVTKLLYPEIAKRFRTTDQKVERAIRNVIEVSWERGNKSLVEEMFGYSAEHGLKRPTNSEFIAVVADRIRMDMSWGRSEN